MRVLVTCPPMLAQKDHFVPILESLGLEAVCPEVVQTLTEDELCALVPDVDGWIIGDDPASRRVVETGAGGRLKSMVKWGIGVDNVDIAACGDFAIPFANTPGMFGSEVADMAMGYIVALARGTFLIDRGIREGQWPKVGGISLGGRTVGVVGYGDIGRALGKRLHAADMNIIAWDPALTESPDTYTEIAAWPNRIDECDFVVLTCSLNAHNRHMVNAATLAQCKPGLRLVNVARGPLVDEAALTAALESGQLHSAALDVFEVEPLPMQSKLRQHPACVFGSHNGSNTVDAVQRTNAVAIEILCRHLDIQQ
jgi:D-3-phosphoglycerate dehydrogenase